MKAKKITLTAQQQAELQAQQNKAQQEAEEGYKLFSSIASLMDKATAEAKTNNNLAHTELYDEIGNSNKKLYHILEDINRFVDLEAKGTYRLTISYINTAIEGFDVFLDCGRIIGKSDNFKTADRENRELYLELENKGQIKIPYSKKWKAEIFTTSDDFEIILESKDVELLINYNL